MQWQFCNYFKNHLHLTACRRRHAGGSPPSKFAAFPRVGTSPSPWRLRRALSQPGELIPAINSHRRRRRHRFPLCSAPPPCSSAARRRPRRAASVVPSYVNAIALVLRSSSICSHRWCWPESPGATVSSPSPAGAPPPSSLPWPGRSRVSPTPPSTSTCSW